LIPSNDEFDAALEQVIAIMRKGRLNSIAFDQGSVAETTNAARDVPSVSAA